MQRMARLHYQQLWPKFPAASPTRGAGWLRLLRDEVDQLAQMTQPAAPAAQHADPGAPAVRDSPPTDGDGDFGEREESVLLDTLRSLDSRAPASTPEGTSSVQVPVDSGRRSPQGRAGRRGAPRRKQASPKHGPPKAGSPKAPPRLAVKSPPQPTSPTSPTSPKGSPKKLVFPQLVFRDPAPPQPGRDADAEDTRVRRGSMGMGGTASPRACARPRPPK
eukprot:gene50654-30555_t